MKTRAFPRGTLAGALMLCANLAAAENTTTLRAPQSLIGETLDPTSTIVLYSSPESGLLRKQVPQMLVGPAATQSGTTQPQTGTAKRGVNVYPLVKDGSEYVVGAPSEAPSLTVLSQRSVIQGKSVRHWLQVQSDGQVGWIQWDPGNPGFDIRDSE